MTPEYTKYEADGWFYLSRMDGGKCGPPWDDSIGRGLAPLMTRFGSAEAREYFIRTEKANYEYAALLYTHQTLRSELAKAVKKRNVRKRILELIG